MNKTGFGMLRFPKKRRDIPDDYDYDAISRMVDRYIALGGKYFDTFYTYLNGCSERAVKECLTGRYPRDAYMLAEKLPGYNCRSQRDSRKFFREECERCGVDWFDVYMLHWLNGKNYEIAEKYDQFGFLRDLKKSGKAKRIGFSYHDGADLLDEILTKHPETDVVQLQINYLDWDSKGIESGRCYDVCVKHGKTVLVMEPVKGGTLADIPRKARRILKEIHPELSPAAWALAFVQSLPAVEICLSGMTDTDQVEENMTDFPLFGQKERDALRKVADIINRDTAVACTGCRYCVSHCPKNIAIPDCFKMFNEITRYPKEDWKTKPAYLQMTKLYGRASDCISCGSCAAHCPQSIPIPEMMKKAALALEEE